MGLIQFVGGLSRAKHGGRMNLLSLLELGHPFCPALRHWHSDSWVFILRLKFIPLVSWFSGLLRIHSIQGIKGLVLSGMYLNIKIEKTGEIKIYNFDLAKAHLASPPTPVPLPIEKREKKKGLEKKNIYGYSGNSHFNQISKLELFTSCFSVPFVYKIKWTYNNLQVWSQHPPASPFLPPSWIPPPSFFIGQPLPMPWPCLPGKAQSSFKNLLKGHTLS